MREKGEGGREGERERERGGGGRGREREREQDCTVHNISRMIAHTRHS